MIQWLNILGGLVAPVTDLYKNYQARKKVKLDSELRVNEAVTNAKIKKVETGQLADIRWENLSIQNSGWKDEFWTIVLSIPCILCFFPGAVQYVRDGFEALKQCPDWYKWCLLLAVGSSFGYRKICDFISFKKGD